MMAIANSVAALFVFGATWLVLAQFDSETGRAGIYAFSISAVVLVMGLYYWQSDRELVSTDVKVIAKFFGGVALLLALSLVVDFAVADVNPFVPSQWHNITRAGGPFGFALTALGAIFFLPFFGLTLVRALVWRGLCALTSHSSGPRA